MQYRFILEPYKGLITRHTCPKCLKEKCFSRYVDLLNEIKFPPYVGRCGRENSCKYHYKPKEYFLQNPEMDNINKILQHSDRTIIEVETRQTSYIDLQIVNQSFTNYTNNNLFQFLVSKFGHSETMLLMEEYLTGTHTHWQGATVFWQIDFKMNTRAGKIMLYDAENGRRIKQPHNHISWVHALLKIEKFNLKQCFFGEHLLSKDTNRAVAIVESEKSALVASRFFPQFIILATGGKNGCFRQDNLDVLEGRQVILIPDLGATEYWNQKAEMMKSIGVEVRVFDYLEKIATTKQLEEGWDIADFILDAMPNNMNENPLIDQKNVLNLIKSALDLVIKVQPKEEFTIN